MVGPEPFEQRHRVVELVEEALVGRRQLVDRPEHPGDLRTGPDAGHLELVAARDGEAVGDVERARRVLDVLLPGVRRDVEAVGHGGSAEAGQPLAQTVPGRSPTLGDGERGEVPASVPAPALAVLQVGALVPLEGAADEGVARRGRPVHGRAPGPLPHHEALGDEPPEARAHLLGVLPAGRGDRVELGGRDGAVGADHAEHQHPGRDLDGRERHDRIVGRPADLVNSPTRHGVIGGRAAAAAVRLPACQRAPTCSTRPPPPTSRPTPNPPTRSTTGWSSRPLPSATGPGCRSATTRASSSPS